MQRERHEADDDEPLELTPDMEVDEGPEDEPEEGEAEGEGVSGDEGEEEGPPLFEDEAVDEGDNATIRRMRERLAEVNRENAELRSRQPPPPMELPPKPTLAEVDYDEDEFEKRLEGWNAQKRRIEDAQAQQSAIVEAANREWQRDLEGYTRRRDELALPDFEMAAEAVKSRLTLAQQATIVKAATDAPAFVYALAHSEGRLSELARIQDPIKLAAAIARMEGGVKVVKKRRAPAPDKPASGTGRMPGTTDKQLEKLEKEAARTGDRTELIRYRKKLAARGKGK